VSHQATITLMAWIGTACLCLAPFTIDTPEGKAMAMVGLMLLTLQAIEKKCYNLVTLNTICFIGYGYALYF
jgi:hypothetical protein